MRTIYAASGNLFIDSWSWRRFVSSCDVFNCLFPLDVQNEIQLLSRFFCYSWLVCLLGFSLRNAPLVKLSEIRFRMASFSKMSLLTSSCCISTGKHDNHCIWCLFVFFSGIKSSVVYAVSLRMFVRFETMIWPRIRFHISLQNFKKPLDIFWPKIERERSEEYLIIILAVKR